MYIYVYFMHSWHTFLNFSKYFYTAVHSFSCLIFQISRKIFLMRLLEKICIKWTHHSNPCFVNFQVNCNLNTWKMSLPLSSKNIQLTLEQHRFENYRDFFTKQLLPVLHNLQLIESHRCELWVRTDCNVKLRFSTMLLFVYTPSVVQRSPVYECVCVYLYTYT